MTDVGKTPAVPGAAMRKSIARRFVMAVVWGLAPGLMCALAASGARAQSDPDFYRGKQVNLYIGYEPGGAYDLYGRMVARHLGKHLPGGPNVLPVNMPGASSMTLGNFLARVAPHDGTALGIVNSALVFDPLFAGANSKAQFRGPDLTAIGNALQAAAVLFSWKSSGVKTLADIRDRGLLIGAMTKTGDTYILPAALKKMMTLDRLKSASMSSPIRAALEPMLVRYSFNSPFRVSPRSSKSAAL